MRKNLWSSYHPNSYIEWYALMGGNAHVQKCIQAFGLEQVKNAATEVYGNLLQCILQMMHVSTRTVMGQMLSWIDRVLISAAWEGYCGLCWQWVSFVGKGIQCKNCPNFTTRWQLYSSLPAELVWHWRGQGRSSKGMLSQLSLHFDCCQNRLIVLFLNICNGRSVHHLISRHKKIRSFPTLLNLKVLTAKST